MIEVHIILRNAQQWFYYRPVDPKTDFEYNLGGISKERDVLQKFLMEKVMFQYNICNAFDSKWFLS